MLIEYFNNLVNGNYQVENIAQALVKTDGYALRTDDVETIDCYEFYRYISKRYYLSDNEELTKAIRKIAPDGIGIFKMFESVLIMEFIDIFEPENRRCACYAA